jgi:hypothetical protein
MAAVADRRRFSSGTVDPARARADTASHGDTTRSRGAPGASAELEISAGPGRCRATGASPRHRVATEVEIPAYSRRCRATGASPHDGASTRAACTTGCRSTIPSRTATPIVGGGRSIDCRLGRCSATAQGEVQAGYQTNQDSIYPHRLHTEKYQTKP